jgi:mono/diheme cytochrome c family protein
MRLTTLAIVLASAGLVTSSLPQTSMRDRGKYLAEEVAHCQSCHTHRLADGEFDRSAALKGAGAAPDITSGGALWSIWGEKGMTRFLTTGTDPAGKGAAAHMPAFRLRPDDAAAIAGYLKSLK